MHNEQEYRGHTYLSVKKAEEEDDRRREQEEEAARRAQAEREREEYEREQQQQQKNDDENEKFNNAEAEEETDDEKTKPLVWIIGQSTHGKIQPGVAYKLFCMVSGVTDEGMKEISFVGGRRTKASEPRRDPSGKSQVVVMSIELTEFDPELHVGVYRCVASNSQGSSEDQATITHESDDSYSLSLKNFNKINENVDILVTNGPVRNGASPALNGVFKNGSYFIVTFLKTF